MLNLKRNLLSAALASAMFMVANQAAAQASGQDQSQQDTSQDTSAAPANKNDKTKKPTELGVVTVSGFAQSLQSAVDAKQSSNEIIEAISAEDIGKLPDVSIAESIARLPGVSAQRVAGRAQVISVRGLSPDFATTLLNGREMVSTGDNRSVEFDQYPSELVSGVTVYKTPKASLIGQGLSGTLDMHTVRPLDYKKDVFVVGIRGQHNSLGRAADKSAFGNRFNASYIGQFMDNTLGVVIGYAHQQTPIQENQVGLYEPWQQVGDGWRPGVPAGTYFSDGIKALRRTGYTKRDGVMATVEWRPTDTWTSTLDLFHTKAVQKDTANQFEVNLGDYNGGYGRLDVTNPTINSNGTFTGGTAGNVYPLVRGMYNSRHDTINAYGWKNEFSVGEVSLVADLSYSKARRRELNLENNTQLLPAPQLDSLNLQYSGSDFSQLNPGLDYSDSSKLFLTNTIYGSGYGKVPRISDELKSAKLGAIIPSPDALSSVITDFEVGVNYADRFKEKHQPEGNINVGAQGDTAIGSDLQYGLVDLGFAGVGKIPSWYVPGAVARYMTFAPNEDASYLVSKAWELSEKITTAYAMADIDTVWGVPVRGNVGVQVQRADQSSSANVFEAAQPVGSQIQRFTNGKKYTDVLPSLNLAFSLTDSQTLRVALAKQVARPRMDDLRASLEFGVDNATGKPGASGGNPQLDPWRANAFDLSWEKYFGGTGYVAAAFFYKDLTSYIYNQTRDNYDYSDLVANYPPLDSGRPILTQGTLSGPFNGKGGNLKGLELSASLPLNMLTPALDGFGILGSASFTDSSVTIRSPENASSVGNGPINLPGLSKRVYNVTAYYEKNGFGARISERKRSDFIGEIGNFNGARTLRYVVGEKIIDAQLDYTFGENTSLHGLSVQLQASNLTNAPYRTYAGTKDRPLEHIEWGRTYLLGATYKF
ncbi:TonB-dependent receptor [Dyella sp.]|jgi:TonB-dependent receptor|uniref:TonB-dependent receptor n=1 Tax=Dyella sp. TaxID=1869338 RepID=UPI002D797BE5|nr:TonB-dependent receptor [Dyella sp.]HET6433667.1 TonB-dependent receptor [Dyella sp.]